MVLFQHFKLIWRQLQHRERLSNLAVPKIGFSLSFGNIMMEGVVSSSLVASLVVKSNLLWILYLKFNMLFQYFNFSVFFCTDSISFRIYTILDCFRLFSYFVHSPQRSHDFAIDSMSKDTNELSSAMMDLSIVDPDNKQE